jgi:hypothetical protein
MPGVETLTTGVVRLSIDAHVVKGLQPDRAAGENIRMKRIRYMDQSYLVGDSMGALMMDFAAALAKIGASEHVRFRGLDPNHLEIGVQIMIGPATQMLAEEVEVDEAEPDNSEVEQAMRERIDMISAIGANQGI